MELNLKNPVMSLANGNNQKDNIVEPELV
jgi:hypothetical protein